MKKHLLLFIGLFLTSISCASDWKSMTFEGYWAEFAPTEDPSYGSTLIAITKITETNYLVIATSTRDPKHLSFYGIGQKDNWTLTVKTNNGVTWKFVSENNADGHESFDVMDDTGELEVASCRRIPKGAAISLSP